MEITTPMYGFITDKPLQEIKAIFADYCKQEDVLKKEIHFINNKLSYFFVNAYDALLEGAYPQDSLDDLGLQMNRKILPYQTLEEVMSLFAHTPNNYFPHGLVNLTNFKVYRVAKPTSNDDERVLHIIEIANSDREYDEYFSEIFDVYDYDPDNLDHLSAAEIAERKERWHEIANIWRSAPAYFTSVLKENNHIYDALSDYSYLETRSNNERVSYLRRKFNIYKPWGEFGSIKKGNLTTPMQNFPKKHEKAIKKNVQPYKHYKGRLYQYEGIALPYDPEILRFLKNSAFPHVIYDANSPDRDNVETLTLWSNGHFLMTSSELPQVIYRGYKKVGGKIILDEKRWARTPQDFYSTVGVTRSGKMELIPRFSAQVEF